MKEWFLSSELAGLNGMPNSVNSISEKARINNWLKRKASGKGRAMEYHISNFHPDVQKQLIETFITNKHDKELLIENLSIDQKTNISDMKSLTEFPDWSQLPVFDVYAAAGAGCLVSNEYQIESISIPTALIEEFRLSPDDCAIIYVDGDSMEPTLSHGDRLLVDTREQQSPVSSGVYIIRIDDSVYVKRLRWDIQSAQYQVISDNTDHPSFHINPNNGRNFKIIGKAIAPIFKRIL